MKSTFLSSAWALILALAAPIGVMAQEPPRYTVTDLGPVGPVYGQAYYITRNHFIAGAATATDGTVHATLWFKHAQLDLGTPGLGGSNSVGFGGNVWGQVTGNAESAGVDPNGEDFCGFKFLGLPTSGSSCVPFVWQAGEMTALPTLGGYNGEGNQINNRGQVAGYAETDQADPNCPAPQVLQFKPVLWSKGEAHALRTFAGDTDGVALAVNDRGQVAGGSGVCAPFSPQLLFSLQSLHALLWEPGKRKPIDLGNLGGTGHFSGNIALNMNGKGEVVGNSDLAGDQANHAFLWTREGGMRDLGTLPGDFISAGLGINDKTEVVGVSLDANFNLRAYLWRDGRMTDLNSLVSAKTPLSLLLACSINADGQIVGFAVDKVTGEGHAFLATPKD